MTTRSFPVLRLATARVLVLGTAVLLFFLTFRPRQYPHSWLYGLSVSPDRVWAAGYGREIPNIIYAETWDRKANQWKTLQGGLIYNPTNGDSANWDYADFADNINMHRTTCIFRMDERSRARRRRLRYRAPDEKDERRNPP